MAIVINLIAGYVYILLFSPIIVYQIFKCMFYVKGDAYRFTLQPVFQNLHRGFRCHLVKRPPTSKILYQLQYTVQVPFNNLLPINWITTWPRHKNIYNSTDKYPIGGAQFDFLTIHHMSGLNQSMDSYVIEGSSRSLFEKLNFTVQPLDGGEFRTEKRPSNRRHRDRIVVHQISREIFVASVQFTEPFAYSTSSWVRDHDCQKDVKYFRKTRSDGRWSEVQASVRKEGGSFQYRLWNNDRQPYIKFSLPGALMIYYCIFNQHLPF